MNVKEMTELRDILSNIVAELNIKIAEQKVDKIEEKAKEKEELPTTYLGEVKDISDKALMIKRKEDGMINFVAKQFVEKWKKGFIEVKKGCEWVFAEKQWRVDNR